MIYGSPFSHQICNWIFIRQFIQFMLYHSYMWWCNASKFYANGLHNFHNPSSIFPGVSFTMIFFPFNLYQFHCFCINNFFFKADVMMFLLLLASHVPVPTMPSLLTIIRLAFRISHNGNIINMISIIWIHPLERK